MNKSTRRPIAFVLSSTNHGSMLVNRHDYHQVNGQTYGVGHQILESSSFDQAEIDFVLQLLEARKNNYGAGVVALDCGANIGVHTIEWAKWMHDWGRVLSFEAQERIFYALAGNITLNNCFNARAIWAAIGSSSGQMRVPVPDYFTPSSFGSLEIKPTVSPEFIGQSIDYSSNQLSLTQMIAIDDLDLTRLDLIKIDIEGMELEALDGAQTSIDQFHPVLVIEKIKSDEGKLREWLVAKKYQIFPMNLNILAIHESDPLGRQIKIA